MALAAIPSRYVALSWFSGVLPLMAAGFIGSLWRPIAMRLSGDRTRPGERSVARLRPTAVLNASAVALLAVSMIAVRADPLGVQIATALPTYLGEREVAMDVRTKMNLLEAVGALERYHAEQGTFAGFDAAMGESLAPDLRWLDRLIRARAVRPIAKAAEIFKSPNVWGLALGYLLMTGIINVILAWLPTYLTTVKKLSIMNVGFVAAAPFVGAVLGNLMGGWFSDRVVDKRRKPTIIITALSSVFMMYALISAPNQPGDANVKHRATFARSTRSTRDAVDRRHPRWIDGPGCRR